MIPTKDSQAGSSSTSVKSNGSNINSGPPVSATPSQHLLKEKDAQIAHLERQLGIMENEFRRELEKLSAAHARELNLLAPRLIDALQQIQESR